MTTLNDTQIRAAVRDHGMIEPFEPGLVRFGRLSHGLSSYGYDLRLSPNEFFTFRHVPGTLVDVKQFNPANLEPAPLHTDDSGTYFILPAHSYGLGVAMERLKMLPYATGICLGKSTYARAGIICNTTPAEAGWEGHLTLEFSNSSAADCKLYACEGVCQIVFLTGEPCAVTYEDRKGKYQHQSEQVTLPRM